MKSGRQKILLVLSCGGMEFTWRYAWAFFISLSILNRPFPLPDTLAVFTMASLVTLAAGYKNWRLYQSLSLHIAGFTIAWLLSTHRFFYRHMPLSNISWMADWFEHLQQLPQGFIQLLFFACLLLFWLGARAMVKRPPNYFPVCLQFDKGLGALFLLLLIKFMVQEKGGILLEDPVTRYLLFAFFTFSLIAISLSRNQNKVEKAFRPGYHSIGIVLGFVSIVLIGSAVIAALLLPYLTLIADSAQSVLKETAAPMGPVVENWIRFLFSIGRHRRDITLFGTGDSIGDQLYPDSEMGWAQGIGWILLGLIGLIAIGFCGYLIRLLVRRLLKRTTINKSKQPLMILISMLLSMIGAILLSVWKGMLFLLKRIDSAAAAYAGMLRWGRRSGLPAAASETPVEYGKRLSQRFPRLKTEIEMIIEVFNREIYGQFPPDKMVLAGIRSARGRMRNPRHWPSRVRTWFAQPSATTRTSQDSKGSLVQ